MESWQVRAEAVGKPLGKWLPSWLGAAFLGERENQPPAFPAARQTE